MAIIVGDNGYVSVADFKAWADERGYDYSLKTDTEIEQAITISSVDFIDTTYGFIGTPIADDQLMKLPTDLVAIADILKAASQATWQQLNGLLFAPISSNQSGNIKRTKDKLDVLESEIEYTEGTAILYSYNTTLIERLLKPFVSASGPRMVRV